MDRNKYQIQIPLPPKIDPRWEAVVPPASRGLWPALLVARQARVWPCSCLPTLLVLAGWLAGLSLCSCALPVPPARPPANECTHAFARCSVTMMTVEEKPDITYSDIGGCKEQIDKMREVRRVLGRSHRGVHAVAACAGP